jgi:glucuronate isomerase
MVNTQPQPLELHEDRFFDPDDGQRNIAREIFNCIKNLPIVSPHTHIDLAPFVDPSMGFGDPAKIFIQQDHYILRMLHAQGVPFEALGIPRSDERPVESDPHQVWKIFAEHYSLFRATPSKIWIDQTLYDLFSIRKKLSVDTAIEIYEQIESALRSPQFSARHLFSQFNIKVLCTTDAPSDDLTAHRDIQTGIWQADIRPTFRPDNIINLDAPDWRAELQKLCQIAGMDISSYSTFIAALENRRKYFRSLGAVASDHAVISPHTEMLSHQQADAIFRRALHAKITHEDAARFTAHMLIELARMSSEDGLVMQLHVGAYRNYSSSVYQLFGPNRGFDFPTPIEFTRSLHSLLDRFGRHPNLRMILFTLDESSYSRELAPLVSAYPALKIGPPWWFHDSLNGIRRYFDQVIETAGLYNTAGFNDDARNFLTIPARHDVWRRSSANWLAGLVVRKIIELDEGLEMAVDLALNLALKAYRLR